MRRRCTTGFTYASVLLASVALARAAIALNACTAADIVGQEGAQCPNSSGPCIITKTYVLGSDCLLDFGSRAVTLSGALDANSGKLTLKAGSLSITATGIVDARGNGIAPATDDGGHVTISTIGAVTIQRLNSNRGRIDVSSNAQAGTIEIDAGSAITIAGRLNADQLTTNGTGGSITLRAGTDIVSLAGSIISSTGGMQGFGGGDMDFGATGKINLGDILDVSGSDGGTVTLNAGDLISVQQIKANGTGDGGDGGSATITAATSVQVLDTMALQGQASNESSGAGDGGTASIEADYGDVVIAATVNANGYAPDGGGGEIDLIAQGAINLQSGTLNARADGSQGTGGLITLQANLSVTVNGDLDASGGIGGGEVDIDAGAGMTASGSIDVSGRFLGGNGGTLTAEAGENGGGAFTINGTIDVTGGACAQGGDCGTGGQASFTGCNLIIGSTANIKAGGPIAGEIDLTAREQLIVSGKVNAAKTIGSGVDGRNLVIYPTRKFPAISADVITPDPTLSGKATCTPANQLNCLIPCPTCGNGIIEFPETCDDGAVGATKSCDGCSPFCQVETCDDGKVCTTDSCDNRLGCLNVAAATACIEPPTPTRTITPTRTMTPTPTSSPTASATPTATTTRSPSNTPTLAPTQANSPTPSAASKATPTATPSVTSTQRAALTATPTLTRAPTSTATPTQTVTTTPTPPPRAATPTAPPTPTMTGTPTETAVPTPTSNDVPGLPGDGNCDGRLSAADLSAIVMVLGASPGSACPLADFNQDGIVDATDLADTTLVEFINFERDRRP